MASFLDFKVDGRSDALIVLGMVMSLERTSFGGIPTSGISGGTISLLTTLEAESDSDTFFASWLAEKTRTHTININCSHLIDNGSKFLTMKLEQASCVGYNINYTFEDGIDSTPENTQVTIIIASPRITIGQAVIELP